MAAIKRNLAADLRGALIEAKESMEGKRKLNTLDGLIDKLLGNNKIGHAHKGTVPLCALLNQNFLAVLYKHTFHGGIALKFTTIQFEPDILAGGYFHSADASASRLRSEVARIAASSVDVGIGVVGIVVVIARTSTTYEF